VDTGSAGPVPLSQSAATWPLRISAAMTLSGGLGTFGPAGLAEGRRLQRPYSQFYYGLLAFIATVNATPGNENASWDGAPSATPMRTKPNEAWLLRLQGPPRGLGAAVGAFGQ